MSDALIRKTNVSFWFSLKVCGDLCFCIFFWRSKKEKDQNSNNINNNNNKKIPAFSWDLGDMGLGSQKKDR